MFARTAAYYDRIYRFKDYADEARRLEQLIRGELPAARSVLDVACGTGEHARHLSRSFRVDGLDLQAEFVAIAAGKVPSGSFRVADMRSFELGVRYDVVLCLFSSIGYLRQAEEVISALGCFRKHLNPEGIVIVEPWFTPAQWKTGMVHMVTVDEPELKLCRMSTSGRDGRLSRVHFHYLVGTPAGVEHLSEEHELALYTTEEMLDCFERAALTARFDPEGIFGRGLYLARVAA